MSLWQLALTFFLIADAIGIVPVVLSLLKDFPIKRQRQILIREGLISLFIALFFQYFGEQFLNLLEVKSYALTLCGGVILLLLALGMIFPIRQAEASKNKEEPFIFPIAVPLIAGAGVLSMIVIFTKEQANNLQVTAAILIAWAGTIAVLALAPSLQRFLGKRGFLALEQLMGMLLVIIAVSVLLKGFNLFMEIL